MSSTATTAELPNMISAPNALNYVFVISSEFAAFIQPFNNGLSNFNTSPDMHLSRNGRKSGAFRFRLPTERILCTFVRDEISFIAD